MADVTRTIRYWGGADRVELLVAALEDDGVRIDSDARYGITADFRQVDVELTATGAEAGIRCGVERFGGRTRRGKVDIEEERDD